MVKTQKVLDFSDEDEVKNEGNFWKPNVGDEIVGHLKEFRNTTYGECAVLTDVNGEEVIIGNYTSLKGKFSEEDIGSAIKIKREDDIKSKTGRMYQAFKIWKKKN